MREVLLPGIGACVTAAGKLPACSSPPLSIIQEDNDNWRVLRE